jgi:hypothetical protein
VSFIIKRWNFYMASKQIVNALVKQPNNENIFWITKNATN